MGKQHHSELLLRCASASWSALLLRCASVRWQRSATATRVHTVAALGCGGAQLQGRQFALGRSRACGSMPGHRANEHSMTRQTSYRVVPGQRLRHGSTMRHATATAPCQIVPCLAVPCGPVGHVYPLITISNQANKKKMVHLLKALHCLL